MRIERIDLKIVRLPLVRPFQTSSSRKAHLDHILVRIVADGVAGWGECACPSDPYYCPETTETCWHILHDFLGPLVLGHEWSSIDELVALYRLVKGNAFERPPEDPELKTVTSAVPGVAMSLAGTWATSPL